MPPLKEIGLYHSWKLQPLKGKYGKLKTGNKTMAKLDGISQTFELIALIICKQNYSRSEQPCI